MNTKEKPPKMYRNSLDHSIISNNDRCQIYNKLELNNQPYQSTVHENHYEFIKESEDIWCIITNSDDVIEKNLKI